MCVSLSVCINRCIYGVSIRRAILICVFMCVSTLKVDNFLPDGLYPVIVSKRPDDSSARTDKGKDNRQEKEPFLQMTIIREINESTNTAHYDYVAFRWVTVCVYVCVLF